MLRKRFGTFRSNRRNTRRASSLHLNDMVRLRTEPHRRVPLRASMDGTLLASAIRRPSGARPERAISSSIAALAGLPTPGIHRRGYSRQGGLDRLCSPIEGSSLLVIELSLGHIIR